MAVEARYFNQLGHRVTAYDINPGQAVLGPIVNRIDWTDANSVNTRLAGHVIVDPPYRYMHY